MMRIITGKSRGTKLNTLPNNNTRPTSERAKEAVFSIIQFDIEGKNVLDVFAGSGQMGLEAISRGALKATFIDSSKEAGEIIKSNILKTNFSSQCSYVCMDSIKYVKMMSGREKFDLVFIDPPYDLGLIKDTLSALLEGNLINNNSTLICESGKEDIFEDDKKLESKFNIIKKAKYGIAYITIMNPKLEV